MGKPTLEAIRKLWRARAQHNEWQLITDEAAFCERVAARLAATGAPDQPADEAQIWRAIKQEYSVRLYQGIQGCDNRAAYEIWAMFRRLAFRSGYLEQEVDDIAQEAVKRLIQKLSSVHSPESLISWSKLLLRTTQRDLRQPYKRETALQREGDSESAPELESPVDMASQVEYDLLSNELVDLIHAKVQNPIGRVALLKVVLYDLKPREIAAELGVPVYQVRVEKSRALQRLRDNERFQQIMAALTDRQSLPAQPGARDDTR